MIERCVTVQAFVEAPLEMVQETLLDFDSWRTAEVSVRRMDAKTGQPFMLLERLRVDLVPLGAHSIHLDATVIDLPDRNTVVWQTVFLGVLATHRYRLWADGEGCLLESHESFRSPVIPFAWPMVKEKMTLLQTSSVKAIKFAAETKTSK